MLRFQLSKVKGPEPTGWSAKALVFSSSVAPGAAISSFSGMMPALKVDSACSITGSGWLRLIRTVSAPRVSMEAMEASRNANSPPSGLARARSSDHFTSLTPRGEPSANFRSGRIVRVMALPSGDTDQALARPGCTPVPSAVGCSRVS